MVKGKSEPVPVFKPFKSQKNKSVIMEKIKHSLKQHRNILGRREELKAIKELMTTAHGTLIIEGDAGLGLLLFLHA